MDVLSTFVNRAYEKHLIEGFRYEEMLSHLQFDIDTMKKQNLDERENEAD